MTRLPRWISAVCTKRRRWGGLWREGGIWEYLSGVIDKSMRCIIKRIYVFSPIRCFRHFLQRFTVSSDFRLLTLRMYHCRSRSHRCFDDSRWEIIQKLSRQLTGELGRGFFEEQSGVHASVLPRILGNRIPNYPDITGTTSSNHPCKRTTRADPICAGRIDPGSAVLESTQETSPFP